MREKLENIKQQVIEEIEKAKQIKDFEDMRIKYLGKKGELTQVLRSMGSLSKEERPKAGELANKVREFIEENLDKAAQSIKAVEKEAKLKLESIDVTVSLKGRKIGHKHPLSITEDRIKDIFIGMGYQIAEGPEVETVYNSFDALNVPKNHPSRDVTDTFYINEDIVLRPHTSPVQIRTMLSHKPPIKIISPGRCFRSDTPDATHSPMFHQIEGLVIDENISMTDLKGTLDVFAKQLFGYNTETKFRPHYFPFTEPSVEVDVTCFKCGGSGCSICKGTGWIEILGGGMVHPNVLQEVNIDPEQYGGFAFGMGLDRVTMLKYGIDDIRLMFENDMRFIEQF